MTSALNNARRFIRVVMARSEPVNALTCSTALMSDVTRTVVTGRMTPLDDTPVLPRATS